MIQEIVNFTEKLDSKIKSKAFNISNGLHLLVNVDDEMNFYISDYLVFKTKNDLSTEEMGKYEKCLFYEKFSSYLSMNQQQKFDKNQKIHSASPFSLAFNFSLGSKKKEIEAALENKVLEKKLDDARKIYKIKEVKQAIDRYFQNAIKLCLNEENQYSEVIERFKIYCKEQLFAELVVKMGQENFELRSLKEKDYIRVYLDSIDDTIWQDAYQIYFEKEYPPNEVDYSDFITTYNQKKPFLLHQTATFDKNLKVSGKNLTVLKEFENLAGAKPKFLPNPLPVFVYQDELQNKVIGLFSEDNTLSFQEIIKKLWEQYEDDFQNYYLINWYKSKDVQIIDSDFVPKFEYKLENIAIVNHFELKEKGGKEDKSYPAIKNIFDFEKQVFLPLLKNKYGKLEYFKDIDSEDYKDRKKNPNEIFENTFISYGKYRKAVYDFVYKSQRRAIQLSAFNELVFGAILDDIKRARGKSDKKEIFRIEYEIKEKLNIWYSLHNMFNPNKNDIKMASKLQDYRDFVARLITDESDTKQATDQQFAFAAGQVINYILDKSKSADTSYQLLEPYLQQSKCTEFKKAITNDFSRYKHENFSRNFERVCAFVLSYETDTNLKHLLPEILSGVFSNNQLYSKKSNQ